MQPSTPSLTLTPTLALTTPLTVALNPNPPNKIDEKWRCKVIRRRAGLMVLGQFSIIYFRGLGLTIGVWVRVRVSSVLWSG